MAKIKQDKKLYSKMRDHGVRKRVARELSELPAHVSDGKGAPKPLREAVDRLEGLVQEVRSHIDSGDRKRAARKAARTRAQGSGGSRSAGSAKSRTGASVSKSRARRSTGRTRARS